MGSNGKVALPEHWTELSAARIHRQQCADEVDAIKKTCLEECGKRNVVECEKCFPKVLERMRARYCDAEGREWFSQRRAFLNELDVMFTDVRDHKKIDLKFIEDSIASEKEAWYRWVLRMYPQFLSTGDSGADQDELRAMLDDPVKRWEELIERIWEGVGKPANWDADVDSLTEKITATKNNAAALKQLYITFFFKDSETGEVVENAQQYLEAYEASDTMSIEQVIDRIVQDHKANQTTEPQRDSHMSRLDELRRAKTAFEQNRLQNKSQTQANQTPAVSESLYNLPPCIVCAKSIDNKDVISCSLCQALVHMGGQRKMAVYCSEECFEKGRDDHTEKEHDCEAGDRCVQYEYEDIEMKTHQPPPPPPPAPSKTFTIDFEVPTQTDVDENFDNLRDSHAQFIDAIFPSDPDTDLSSFEDSPLTGFPTPSSSHTHSIQSLHAKPQFNLDSAESLLVSFRGMLVHYPVIVLKPDETVAGLAATKPFVLLAILAAASGSRTLQGHTLYDEEFRKVLGLKFVAGGERSMELLQGILIYCAWYPFHLRPKNRQAFQYYRMAGDLADDLDLDQEIPNLNNTIPGDMSSMQLDRLRAYLAYHYAVSTFIGTWKKMDLLVPKWTPWTATCCELLQRHAQVDGDVSLSYLVRLANMTNTANNSVRDNDPQGDERDYGATSLSFSGSIAPVKLAHMFFDIFLQGGAIFYLTRTNPRKPHFIHPSAARLARCVNNIRVLFDHLHNLDSFTYFTSVDWIKFILSVILAVRLSFPITDVPDWDHAWARQHLRFDEFLEFMCDGPEDLTPSSKSVDVLSASRVILRVLKAKYDRRVAMLTAPSLSTKGVGHQGCPMFDKDMQPYISAWDTEFDMNSVMLTPGPNMEGQPMYHDLWATMTMGWANEGPME
ncbi:hypothetical protein F53441_10925 [Fusarium austroafricanum]|uniref:MYND-type zinc finger protein samB n=1 Tax=Fusarium austroafricanum TaxID=2364996 RepID=A0A8H4K9F1_9HYPO|nr:hypothetical protein F53441_10925 [Fusarium austroafricanum]